MTIELNNLKQLINRFITETDNFDTLNKLQLEAEQLPDLILSGIFQLSGDYQIKTTYVSPSTSWLSNLYRYLRNTPSMAAKKN